MHLERWQAEKVRDAVHPSLAYLHRLRDRMEKAGVTDYRLLELVRTAENDLQSLFLAD